LKENNSGVCRVRTVPIFFLLIGVALLSLPCASHGEGMPYRAQAENSSQRGNSPKGTEADEDTPASNMSIIKGIVLKNSVAPAGSHCMGSGDVLYRMVISLKEIEGEAGYENFLRDMKGRTMTFFATEKPSDELKGKKIRAVVTYKGDRRCRLYWIEGIEVVQ
jgi:hypothetical protein